MEDMEVVGRELATASTRRTTCRVCGSCDLELVLDYGRMPLAGGFAPAGDPQLDEAYPLTLARCSTCTLLQVVDNVPVAKIFSTYSYASSYNRSLVRHFAQVAERLQALSGGGLIVEFGCNDGVLLNPLRAAGARVVGVDPSDVAARASAKHGWPLYRDYFNRNIAKEIQIAYGPAKIIAASNVCAHVDDPNELIQGVAELLEPDGLFVFEVHYQGDLMEWYQYDTVYHEHTCYYSLTSLARLLGQHGLRILDVGRIPIHSGSICVTAGRAGCSHPVQHERVTQLLDAEKKWDIARFAQGVRRRRDCLAGLVGHLAKAGKKIVAYGASGRATILLNYCGLGPDLIDHVSDLSPLRYGRLVPGVRVPILPRTAFHERCPDYAIITAWNYETEIVADEEEYLGRGGVFIVPLPEVRLIC